MQLFRKMGQPDLGMVRVLRNVGVGFTAAGGAILTSPVTIPATMVNLAGYVMIIGMVMSIICQAIIKDGEDSDGDSMGDFGCPGPNPLLDADR